MTLFASPLARRATVIVLALVALRLLAAALTPLAFDEAYYWMWSQHLAGGYYDHPPMVALVIRAGTLIAGDSEFGVRLVSILLALPMSFAVYRATDILFGSERAAATAAILLNVTLVVAVGTIIVTPDAPLMVASAFVLLFLAKVLSDGRGVWWLAVGAAVGAALLSKYTALFFGVTILAWVVAVPKLRRWLVSPWPYLGFLVTCAMIAPVVAWNAEHGWVSFAKQFGRARFDGLTLRFIGELIPAQMAFATPPVFLLGAMGLAALLTRRGGPRPARLLISLTLWPILIYFVVHSLHSHIEANWLAPVYPAFAIAAAVAAHEVAWSPRWQRAADLSRRFALPVGVVMLVALIVQANTGWLNGNRRDPTLRSIGMGWPDVAREVETARVRSGAMCVLAPDYGTTAWLAFYLPRGTCVRQAFEPIRWVNMPAPDAAALGATSLLVDSEGIARALVSRCSPQQAVGEAVRRRGQLAIERYALVAMQCPLAQVLGLPVPKQ
ncbi:MAG: glycosyl transferase [Proteobacteria bacterium]|nr:MAG: glycosyl transferase [Pseudomonadota bacterium]